jgi:hypothetical protein
MIILLLSLIFPMFSFLNSIKKTSFKIFFSIMITIVSLSPSITSLDGLGIAPNSPLLIGLFRSLQEFGYIVIVMTALLIFQKEIGFKNRLSVGWYCAFLFMIVANFELYSSFKYISFVIISLVYPKMKDTPILNREWFLLLSCFILSMILGNQLYLSNEIFFLSTYYVLVVIYAVSTLIKNSSSQFELTDAFYYYYLISLAQSISLDEDQRVILSIILILLAFIASLLKKMSPQALLVAIVLVNAQFVKQIEAYNLFVLFNIVLIQNFTLQKSGESIKSYIPPLLCLIIPMIIYQLLDSNLIVSMTVINLSVGIYVFNKTLSAVSFQSFTDRAIVSTKNGLFVSTYLFIVMNIIGIAL